MSLVLLTSCTKAPSSVNDTYLQRLANTLNLESDEPPPLVPLKLNSPPVLNKAKITLGIVELAGISRCNLNVVISEHNNQLGKTATAAGRLKYQIDFIQEAEQCLSTLEIDSPVYKKINEAKEQKQAHLMHYFNLMLFKEPELNRTWSLTSSELSSKAAGFSDTQAALNKLITIKNQIKSNDFNKINTDNIYSALEQLNKFRFNQILIQSVRQQIVLNHLATQLVTTLNLDEMCISGRNKKTAKIISNVFQKFYLDQIQPYQASLTGYLEVLQPMYYQLWFEQSVTPEQINKLLAPNSQHNLLNQLKTSAVDHVVWWQKFYKTCEISPI